MNIDELESTLEREVAFVREQARVAGGWGEVLKRYQITMPPVATTPTVQQLRIVVNGLVMQCAIALEKVQNDSPRERAIALWHRLTHVVDEEARAHEPFASPAKPRSKLLGNIMANATASVNEEFWTKFKWNERMVALCKVCGAPQQLKRDYHCRFCDGEMFHTLEERFEDE